MSSAFAKHWGLLDQVIERLRYHAVKRHILAGSVLVDIGSGHGEFLLAMEASIRSGIGYDPNITKRTLSDKVSLRVLPDDCILDLPSASADIVTMLAVIEHIPTQLVVGMFEEIYRVLKPGGYLLLTTPAPHSQWLLEWLAFRLRVISDNDIADHKHYYNESDLRSLCAAYSDVSYSTFLLGLNQLVITVK